MPTKETIFTLLLIVSTDLDPLHLKHESKLVSFGMLITLMHWNCICQAEMQFANPFSVCCLILQGDILSWTIPVHILYYMGTEDLTIWFSKTVGVNLDLFYP